MELARPECLLKMESVFPSMNTAEKKAAEFILENGERVLNMTISEVATESGVSETTIFKLCRSLDYGGFRDFKLALARQSYPQLSKTYLPVKKSDGVETVARKVFSLTTQSLEDTLQVLDFGEVERAYQALKSARKVLVMALSSSRPTAIFAADKLSLIGIDAQYVTDIHYQAMKAALMTKRDVLLGFSRSGDTRDIIEVTQVAKEAGAVTIGVTNNPRSYFAKLVDIKLIARSRDTRFRNDILASRVEHFSVVDMLFTLLAIRNMPRASRLYKKINSAATPKQL